VRPLRAAALLVLVVPTTGCCGLFHLFGCADRRPLVPIRDASPDQALATLQAAIAFSDQKVIYEALSPSFKKATGIPDGVAFSLAWDKLLAEHPYVPAVGDAVVVESQRLPVEYAPDGDGGSKPIQRHRFVLDAHGHKLELVFEAISYWEIGRYPESEEEKQSIGGRDIEILSDYTGRLEDTTQADPDKGRILVDVESFSALGTSMKNLAYVHTGWAWKVSRLAGMQ